MALTFNQIISAWGKCMNENDANEIRELLADDFVWHSAVPEHKAPADDKADKTETITTRSMTATMLYLGLILQLLTVKRRLCFARAS